MVRCPGQDPRYWKPEDIFEVACPGCGNSLELWKDEANRQCPNCKQKVWNPRLDLACAAWCRYGEQCMGTAPDRGAEVLCDRIILKMRAVFGADQKRIDHALGVLKYATDIQQAQGGDPLVVKAAAILHDIGISQYYERKAPVDKELHEQLGAPIAQNILTELGVSKEATDHVCRIIANHHSSHNIDTIEFKIIWDADWLMNIPTEYAEASNEELHEIIAKTFETDEGRRLATKQFLGPD